MQDRRWTIAESAKQLADTDYDRELAPVDVSALASVLGDFALVGIRNGIPVGEMYADAPFDLHRLLEEVGFEIAFAVMLDADYQARHSVAEEGAEVKRASASTQSVDIAAMLTPPMIDPPSPSVITTDFHRTMSGRCHLSRWVAGQLLDGALFRAVPALDRVATIVHLPCGRPLADNRDGSMRMPTFTERDLRDLRPILDPVPEGAVPFALLDHPIFKLLKRFRNGNVHRRRWPSELHGERTATYWSEQVGPNGEPGGPWSIEGLTVEDHFAVALAVRDLVLRPSVETAGTAVRSVAATWHVERD